MIRIGELGRFRAQKGESPFEIPFLGGKENKREEVCLSVGFPPRETSLLVSPKFEDSRPLSVEISSPLPFRSFPFPCPFGDPAKQLNRLACPKVFYPPGGKVFLESIGLTDWPSHKGAFPPGPQERRARNEGHQEEGGVKCLTAILKMKISA